MRDFLEFEQKYWDLDMPLGYFKHNFNFVNSLSKMEKKSIKIDNSHPVSGY